VTPPKPAERRPVPEAFQQILDSLSAVSLRGEVEVGELPTPTRLAPYAVALGGRLRPPVEDESEGRLVVLHDPAGQEGWDGDTRIVAFVRTAVDRGMADDPMLPTVGWSWLLDALETHGAAHSAASGTVTRTISVTFGGKAEDDDSAEVEIRASWTPVGRDLGPHLAAWVDLMCLTAGLPPDGVAAIRVRRPPGA